MKPGFQDQFSGVASRYADFRPRYPAELFDYLATLVPADAVVWDCAAGNGQASHDLGTRFGRVIASDASRDQIATTESRTNVEFRVAPAEYSGLEDAAIDLITVAQANHWFDRDRFHQEARRVLKPRGVLAVRVNGVNVVEGDEVDTLVQDFHNRVVGPFWPPERALVETGYRTIDFPFAEIEAPAIQMEARWTMAKLPGYSGTWSATGCDPLPPLREQLARVWQDAAAPRRVVWPLSLRVGRK